MYSPARSFSMRFLAFFGVIVRRSGPPRSQLRTRLANITEPMMNMIGMTT